ncbi:hypothetical protein [Amycolatopsis cihanbeyliensis]|uniref:Uncharacterized protein n=1 Tax=Amycolatopsis cihanbeyliensis TaxID=1128664 RepID=A0A542DRW1_AMYCI|nr:hypothetical protein [Amycolatopsis cihanbeyliensis]TQJ05820.1 hypothetical protein FB471_5661 [Amycolatopsis cihanbeyliensis]
MGRKPHVIGAAGTLGLSTLAVSLPGTPAPAEANPDGEVIDLRVVNAQFAAVDVGEPGLSVGDRRHRPLSRRRWRADGHRHPDPGRGVPDRARPALRQ